MQVNYSLWQGEKMQSEHDRLLDEEYKANAIYLCKWCGKGTRGYDNAPTFLYSGHTGNIIGVIAYCSAECKTEHQAKIGRTGSLT